MNFPNNPQVNDTFEWAGITFVWTGTVWALLSSEAAGGGVPRGGIMMWSGAVNAVPVGWALCDGTQGTPDLRGRFIIGAGGVYVPGNTGGAESVTLTETQIPAHTHAVSLTTDQEPAHTHGITDPGHTHSYTDNELSTATPYNLETGTRTAIREVGVQKTTGSKTTGITVQSGGAHTHAVSGNTGSRGGGQSHENLPPYLALAYIMRL